MLQLLLAVSVVLLSSALCSGTEAALLSIPLNRVRQLAETRSGSALTLLAIREKIGRPIAAIVILNNVANIVGSIAVGSIAAAVLGDQWLGVFSGALTFCIIVFSEILPKTLGERYAEGIALLFARPVRLVTRLLLPVIWLVEHITAPFTQGRTLPSTNESEIKLLARIGREEGVIEADESEMIQRVFRLNDLRAVDVMTPRVAMTYLHGDTLLGAAQAEIIASPHSRIVVVGETPDEVLGLALKSELLTALIQGKGDQAVRELVRPVHHVPEIARADRLLEDFRKNRSHLAVVSDEWGGVSGVVSLEDVLETLTGEIVDETDRVVNLQEAARRSRKKK